MLLRKGTGIHDGTWCLPGGKVEEDESPMTAALRELDEEIGIIPAEIKFSSTIFLKDPSVRFPGKYFTGLGLFFVIEKWNSSIVNKEPHKHEKIQFFDLKRLPNPLMPPIGMVVNNYLNSQSYGECLID